MRLDTIFGTGGFRTVHLGEAVPLGWDGGVVQLRGAVFVLEVLAADRAVEMFQETLVRTGGLLTLHLGEVVAQSIHIRLLHNHIAARGTDLSFRQAVFRTGGGSGKNRLRMLGGISRNLLEGQRAIGHSFLSQHIGFGTQVPYHRHVHRLTRTTKGLTAVIFQIVEVNILVCKGCLGHGVAAFKEEGTYIAAIQGGGLQVAAEGKHCKAGSDPAIAAIHDHILRNVDGGQGSTFFKDVFSRLDCPGAKINGCQGFAIGKAVIPQRQRGIPEGNGFQVAAAEGIAADAGNAFRHHKGGDAACVAIPGGGGKGGVIIHIPGAGDGQNTVAG